MQGCLQKDIKRKYNVIKMYIQRIQIFVLIFETFYISSISFALEIFYMILLRSK